MATEFGRLNFSSPEVLEVNAAQQPGVTPHLHWRVGVAPDVVRGGRVVFSTLHAFSLDGGGEVTLGSTMFGDPENVDDTDTFIELLKASDALETLYDVTRAALRSLLALLPGEIAEMDMKAPEPAVDLLETKAPDGDDPHTDLARTVTGQAEDALERAHLVMSFVEEVAAAAESADDWRGERASLQPVVDAASEHLSAAAREAAQ